MVDAFTLLLYHRLRELFVILDLNFKTTYQQIIDLYEDNENIDEYIELFENLQNDIFSVHIGDYAFLLYPEFSKAVKDKKLKNELKKYCKTIESQLTGIGSRLKLLDNKIYNHYNNKKIFEEKEAKRQKAINAKEIEKAKKEELLAQISTPKISKNTFDPEITQELDKLSAMMIRVENLEEKIKSGNYLNAYKEEIISIDEKLQHFSRTPETIPLIQKTQFIISHLLSEEFHETENILPQKTIQITENSQLNTQEPIETHIENLDFIKKIDDLLRINHSISSTKNKTDSYGDGSFVSKIFRNFLYAIKNIFEKNEVSFRDGISWEEIINIFEKNNDDADRARTHFRGILKKYKNKTIQTNELLVELYNAIQDFSETNFYHGSKDMSLKNFLEKFLEIIE